MLPLLTVVLIYISVFGADYLSYMHNVAKYRYVSIKTYLLFLAGKIALLYVFWQQYSHFRSNFYTEITFLVILLVLLMVFSHALNREGMLVCHSTSRTERCLTPGYVLVKGSELVFQQLAYAAIAFSLVPLLGAELWAYIAYTMILIMVHTPVILSMNVPAKQIQSFGIFSLSIPIFYIYTQLDQFWPALYLHALIYIFFWLWNANWEGKAVLLHMKHKNFKIRG